VNRLPTEFGAEGLSLRGEKKEGPLW